MKELIERWVLFFAICKSEIADICFIHDKYINKNITIK